MADQDEGVSEIEIGEASTANVRLPLYNVQLQEVVLWQLEARRVQYPAGLEDQSEPSVNIHVEFAPDQEEQQIRSAKLTLDYAAPSQDAAPGYEIHAELIGVFRSLAQDAVLDREEGGQHNGTGGVQPQGPLNDYTVISLLWPYMRELAHQVQSRMRVPIRLLPTLDLMNLQAQEASGSDGE